MKISQHNINEAVTILLRGGLVAIPTETVYGLGADARNLEALQKIFHAKQRPVDHPLIVHIANMKQLTEWAVDISDAAYALAKTFWPGPLTLILKKAPSVLDLITGHQATVGIRIPNHPITLALLDTFGSGIAAPSANRFGRISPTTAEAVREELGDAVDMILDGGPCDVGVESTIVDVSSDTPVILRPGMITKDQIEAVLHAPLLNHKKNAPRVSGSHASHYAPQTKTVLVNSAQLDQYINHLKPQDLPIAIVSRRKLASSHFTVQMSDDPKAYAHDLYQTLRGLDKKGFRQIVIESVPESSEWDAIRDRLGRASISVSVIY